MAPLSSCMSGDTTPQLQSQVLEGGKEGGTILENSAKQKCQHSNRRTTGRGVCVWLAAAGGKLTVSRPLCGPFQQVSAAPLCWHRCAPCSQAPVQFRVALSCVSRGFALFQLRHSSPQSRGGVSGRLATTSTSCAAGCLPVTRIQPSRALHLGPCEAGANQVPMRSQSRASPVLDTLFCRAQQ
jgi:hypothetical protein